MSVLGSRTAHMMTAQVIGLAAIVGYMVLLSQAMDAADLDVWGLLIVLPVLVLANAHLLVRCGNRDPDPMFIRILVAAFVLKALATLARYLMTFVWYDGAGDALGYHQEGARLAESYGEGVLDAPIGRDFIGTGFIRVLTGVIYTVTGPSIFVAYAVFSLLSFWGLYFLYRAFCVGVPDGDRRRYAVLLLFLPSMLFWPSGLGKEAWMVLGIGLAAYGAARVLSGHRRWLVPLTLGLVATGLVRPHITAALFGGLAVAQFLRRSRRPATELTPLVRLAGIAVVLVAGVVVVTRAATFLGVEDVSLSSIEAAIHDTQERTADGGSEFDADPVNSPLEMPAALVSVLFRPFLFEAHNVAALLAALEGTVLLVLFALTLRQLRGLLPRLLREPYLVMCGTYALLFVYAFSNFTNFGILTRQRVQVLPFVLVLVALQARAQRRDHDTTPTRQEVSA